MPLQRKRDMSQLFGLSFPLLFVALHDFMTYHEQSSAPAPSTTDTHPISHGAIAEERKKKRKGFLTGKRTLQGKVIRIKNDTQRYGHIIRKNEKASCLV